MVGEISNGPPSEKPGPISMMIRHISFSGLAALIAAALVGCAVGPDYPPPETKVPSTWDGQNAVTPAQPSKTTLAPVELVEWWTAFNDPTLSSLVDMAVRANLDVRLAERAFARPGRPEGVAARPSGPRWMLRRFTRGARAPVKSAAAAPSLPLGDSGICGRRVSMPPGR